jgi:hypothetical protein
VTAAELAMDTQTATALISGGVALFVALLGIGGAIVAQLVATRRAFSNSLAMFERQRTADVENRAQERAEAARREEVQRFADERRLTYAKFLRLVRELRECHRVGAEPNDEILDQYREFRTQIDLLASEPVRAAADRLSDASTLLAWPDYPDARAAFVDAARRELGMPPDSDSQLPADQDGNMPD